MHVHRNGLIVAALIIVLAATIGAVGTVAIARVVMLSVLVTALLDIVINMVRHRDTQIRSQLFDWMAGHATFNPKPH